MQTCRNCFRHIEDDIAYCPYCGNRIYVTPVPPVPVPEHPAPVRKPVSKKKLAIIIIACILLVAQSIATVVCETRIYQAKLLYEQGEYHDAYYLVDNIPTLGRESLIRIETAWWAAGEYESYLVTKRIRLDKDGYVHEDAYQDALFKLIFGLYLNKKELDRGELNRIEIDEVEKFNELMYEELLDTFSITRYEADELIQYFEDADSISQMHDITNAWVEMNMFS